MAQQSTQPRTFSLQLTDSTGRRTHRLPTLNGSESYHDIYHHKQDVFRECMTLGRELAWRAHPDTGGNEMLVHNWGNADSKAVWERVWKLERRLSRMLNRAYERATHQEHIDRGELGRYLWCDACKAYCREKITAPAFVEHHGNILEPGAALLFVAHDQRTTMQPCTFGSMQNQDVAMVHFTAGEYADQYLNVSVNNLYTYANAPYNRKIAA